MTELEQLSLFNDLPQEGAAEEPGISSSGFPLVSPPKKNRIFTLEAELDELTAKKLLSLWDKQLKRWDKNPRISMQIKEKNRSWQEMSFLCVDTETTGLDRSRHRVIEIAWVHFHHQKILKEEGRLCRIAEPLPPEIIQLTGITDEMLKHEKSFPDHIDDFLAALSQVDFVVAYNANFDRQFIEAEMLKIGKTLPDLPWVDPCVFIREIDRYQKSKKLGDTAARWGIELNNAHRALADAVATGKLLYKIAPFLKINSLEALIKQQLVWREQQEKSYQAYLAKKKNSWM